MEQLINELLINELRDILHLICEFPKNWNGRLNDEESHYLLSHCNISVSENETAYLCPNKGYDFCGNEEFVHYEDLEIYASEIYASETEEIFDIEKEFDDAKKIEANFVIDAGTWHCSDLFNMSGRAYIVVGRQPEQPGYSDCIVYINSHQEMMDFCKKLRDTIEEDVLDDAVVGYKIRTQENAKELMALGVDI